ncbi:MAG: DUF6514 family protein [Clostridia bacterium]|nr:DUF6514 family protein [Clostridia bacterium]
MTTYNVSSKNTYVCEITENNVFIEDTGNVTVYGINMYNRDSSIAKLDGEHCCIEDISDNIEQVRNLREMLVEYNIYPVHLKDIVEDMLT